MMQPFRFHSIYQPRIWGGQHMRTLLGRDLPDRETAYGEAWEISDRPEAMSIVKEGEWGGPCPCTGCGRNTGRKSSAPAMNASRVFRCCAKYWTRAKTFPSRCISGTHGGGMGRRSKK